MALYKREKGQRIQMTVAEESAIRDEWAASDAKKAEDAKPKRHDVNAERDRRIALGFLFNSKAFDFDNGSRDRVTGAGALAHIAITIGKKLPTDPKWHDGAANFAWIAQDNTLVEMDAQTVLAFGQAAGRHESAHIFAAKAIKDMDEIPTDYTADKYWP